MATPSSKKPISRWYLAGGYVMLIGVLIAGPLLLPMSTENRRLVFRIQISIVMQMLLLISTTYIWKSVSAVIDYHTSYAHNGHCSPSERNWTRLLLKAALIAFLALSHCSFVFYTVVHQTEPHWLAYFTFSCLGFYVQFLTYYFFLNRLVRLLAFFGIRFGTISDDKVGFVRVFYIAVLLSGCFGSYGLYKGQLPPVVKRVDIAVKGFPSSMNGLSIALISDTHLGSTIGKTRLDQAIDIANGLQPDIVAVVGDLADGTVEHFQEAAQNLKHLHGRLGKFFVTGNHEYHNADVDNWFVHLEKQLGFTVLHNSHVEIRGDKGDFFYLAGTDDIEPRRMKYGDHGMDLDKAVGSCAKDRPIVLLAHQPRAAMEALDSKYNIQLVLSGHTHGGQLMPMTILAYFVNPFFAGLYSYREGQVYVSQGTMYWGIPMRMFSESEITHIILRNKA